MNDQQVKQARGFPKLIAQLFQDDPVNIELPAYFLMNAR